VVLDIVLSLRRGVSPEFDDSNFLIPGVMM
jgi:hypothetical protein